MEQISIINEQEVLGKNFKIYGDFENPLFLAKDVAEWIEHSNPRMMLQNVENTEKVKIEYPVNNPYGGIQIEEQWFLTEDGLYEVLMQSRKPIAKEFKKEVKIILKTIRKTGGAVVLNREEEFINNYFPLLSEDVKKSMVIDLHSKLKEQKEARELAEQKIKELEPIAEFGNTIGNCEDSSILIRDYAKLLHNDNINIGQNKLFAWFEINGYTYREKDNSIRPYQQYINMGLFTTKETMVKTNNHGDKLKITIRITGKGQQYFYKKIKDTYKKGA